MINRLASNALISGFNNAITKNINELEIKRLFMNDMKIRTLVAITMVGDFILYYASFVASIYFINKIDASANVAPFQTVIIVVSILTWLLLMRIFEMYKNIFYRSSIDIVLTIFVIVLINAFFLVVASYFLDYKHLPPNRVLIVLIITQAVLLIIWRLLMLKLRKNNMSKQQIMIVGELSNATVIAQKITNKQGHLFDVKYIYDANKSIDGIYDLLQNIDHIIVGNQVSFKYVNEIFIYCMKNNKNVFFLPDIRGIYLRRAKFIQLDDVPVFNSTRFGLSFEQRLLKRGLDLIVSSVAILLLLPIMAVVALAVKITSPGPIFYKQVRATVDNREYHIIKFRTMVNNAETMTGPVLATANDSRITPIGKFLRATRLDELPQLFNVLSGSMSLVGPRPERPYFIEQFTKDSPAYMFRTQVKAGITGLAQVFGKYTTDFDDKLRYDLLYIRNYSITLDLKILMRTIKVVLSRESSDGVQTEENMEKGFIANGYKIVSRSYGYEICKVNEM